MEHYFTETPSGEHQLKEIHYTFRRKVLTFLTDSQVFSRDHVDFGTSLLIQTMELGEEDLVLDLGAGYGPIGIAAALLATRGKVILSELNERAVDLARRNLQLNGIKNAEVFQSDGVSALPAELIFDSVLTNPPIRAGKKTVFRFYEEAFSRLKEGGALWVVIQKKQGADSTEKKLKELFRQVDRIRREKGYRILRAIK